MSAEAMVDALAKRGPDGRGLKSLDGGKLILGHRRLSIIDLSEAAAQPMCNEDGSIWLTFNGEIYNYIALRSRLTACGHVFRSRSDSETIIHAYEEWGRDCVRHLHGIFAFAIYDGKERSLFLARDHVGVKPLYYTNSSDRFVFASQPKSIAISENYRPRIDEQALSLYLAYGNVPGSACIYEGIQKLPPGHWLSVKDGKINVRQYWALRYEPKVRDVTEAEELIRSKVEESVQLQAISDVPIGTFLSGGVDSTVVTAILAKTGAPLSTFTIGFDDDGSDESPYARAIAAHWKTRHHEWTLTRERACALLPQIVEATDEPFHLNGLFPFFAVSELAQSNGTKVILGGDGADEIFAGYRWYERFQTAVTAAKDVPAYSYLLAAIGFRRGPLSPVEEFFHYNGTFDHTAQRERLGVRFTPARKQLYAPLASSWEPALPPVLAAQLMDFNCFLVDHCLTKVDRMSMACGVEVRVPFLDVGLVEAAFSIDHGIIFRGSERKALLKSAMKACFPSGMDTMRKKGFSSPVEVWLGETLARVGEQFVIDGGLAARGLIDVDKVARSYSRLTVSEQLVLLGAELWCRRWMENDSRSVVQLSRSLLDGVPRRRTPMQVRVA
jgi:asparagine synthase (glutamine-hydrolysing)